MRQDVPIRAKINKNNCILVIRDASVHIKFVKFQESMDILYDTIRCSQHVGNSVLLVVEKKDRLVSYVISSTAAKKIHETLCEICG